MVEIFTMDKRYKKQQKIWIDKKVWDGFLQLISHEFPSLPHGIISTKVEQAIIHYMECDRKKRLDASHTHTNDKVDSKVQQIEKQELTNNISNSIEVWVSSSGKQWPMNDIELSKRINIEKAKQPVQNGDVVTEWIKHENIKITPENIANARCVMSDPEYRDQWIRESYMRLEAKENRQTKQKLDSTLEARLNKSREIKNLLIQYLNKIDRWNPDTCIVDKRFLFEGLREILNCKDSQDRAVKGWLNTLIVHTICLDYRS